MSSIYIHIHIYTLLHTYKNISILGEELPKGKPILSDYDFWVGRMFAMMTQYLSLHGLIRRAVPLSLTSIQRYWGFIFNIRFPKGAALWNYRNLTHKRQLPLYHNENFTRITFVPMDPCPHGQISISFIRCGGVITIWKTPFFLFHS